MEEEHLQLDNYNFESDLLSYLGGGTPDTVFYICALVVIVLGENDQLFDGEGPVVVLFVLFLITFHLVLEHFVLDHGECTEECRDIVSGLHRLSAFYEHHCEVAVEDDELVDV